MSVKKLFVLAILSCGFVDLSLAQNYWQQEVNYTITVRLDDVNHKLIGQESFEYVNNSPNSLQEIRIHLWPNAYKNGKTALAKQQYRDGNEQLTFSSEKDRGWIDSLDFKVDGIKANWKYNETHQDICIISLQKPLNPGERISISTPFIVKIPSGKISRLGHIEQSYQITQWFPKPAVYDKDGWHDMPYLNQGEFYSEFGSFDVSITLPKNYVIAATGDLQTQSEFDFRKELEKATRDKIAKDNYNPKSRRGGGKIPESSKELKTVRFTQDKVHDFAWFADKRYEVLSGEIELPHSKRKVKSWAFFTPDNTNLWQKAIEYINDGTYYYSLWNGDYPYNSVTAVDGTISAGGGMEYPTITVIGNAGNDMELETVIVHEVGHNWFYGILGSNERDHGWMDEGINTLNEVRYIQTKYPNNNNLSEMVLGGSFHFNDLDHFDSGDMFFRTVAGFGIDQAIETKSEDFLPTNYGVVMYQKTGLVFNYLRQYLGSEKFDECMHNYFETWKFKHPQPADIKQSLESCSGKNLDWLFVDLIQTCNHVDFKLKQVKRIDETSYKVTVKNVGQVDAPISVHGLQGDSIVSTVWIEPGSKVNEITLKSNSPLDGISISADKAIPELKRQNNNWKSKGLFKRFEKPTLEFLIGDNESRKSNMFWTPIVAGNFHDKFMIGAAFHNYGLPTNKFKYLIAPMYSFGRNYISGISEFCYVTLPKDNIRLSKIGVSVKSFKDDSILDRNESFYFIASPYWFAKFGKRSKMNSPFESTIRLQSMYRADVFGSKTTEYCGAFVEYNLDFVKPDHKMNTKIRTDFASNLKNSDQFGRSSLEAKYSYRYLKNNQKRWISLRGYIGGFWNNQFNSLSNPNYLMSISGMNGTQDLFVEDYFFGRNITSGIWSNQRLDNMGGFSSTTTFGTTNQWMATANIYIQIPVKPNMFGIFVDVGTVKVGAKNYNLFNTGLALKLSDVFGVYFPIYMNDHLENSFVTKKYGERIRFMLKMNVFNRDFKFKDLI